VAAPPQPHSATHYGEPNQARRELSFIAPSSTNYTILVHYTSTLYVCRSSQLASSSSSSSSSLKLPHIKQRTRQNLVQNTSRASLGRPSFSRSLAHQIPPSPLRAAVHYHAEETTQTALPSLFRAGDVPAAVEWRSVPHTSHKRTVSPYEHSICTVHLTGTHITQTYSIAIQTQYMYCTFGISGVCVHSKYRSGVRGKG
jgi:hypothetical protein